jgi:CubicO group peptidase (beta-lactamase class C family)
MTSPDLSSLHGVMTAEEHRGFAGVVLVVHRDDVLFSGAYGPASRRWPVPVTMDTRFDVASVTKLFTSVAVLQLVGEKRLDLDATIHDHVELASTPIPVEVTLRHLLTHTSGIADDADEEAGESYEELWRDRPNYTVTETADLLAQCTQKEPLFAPGAGCRYCNCGYVLAGRALEKVTGERYRDRIRTHVFEKAGMTRSGFFDMRDDEPDVAEGWERGADRRWRRNIYSYPPIGSPDGGAFCTAGDLVAFLRALRGGRLLDEDLTRQFLTPQALHDVRADGTEVHYGFGMEFRMVDGSVRSWSKDRVNAGASAYVGHEVGSDVDIAVLGATGSGAWRPVRAVTELVRAVG